MNDMMFKNEPNVLIAYFSYSGVTRRIAERLREETSGVLWEILPLAPYEERTVYSRSKRELNAGPLPELKHPLPSIAFYDLVLVGGPVWEYTVSTPVMTFLRDTDFCGKRVAAFCTHGGGVGAYFKDFGAQIRGGKTLSGLELYRPRRESAGETDRLLVGWLERLGLARTSLLSTR